MNRPILALIISIILLASMAYGIGIMPAKSTSYGDGSNTFTIVNTEALDMDALITLEGDTAEYIALNTTTWSFSATTERQTLTYAHRAVDTQRTGYIVVTQVPRTQDGQILPRIAVKHMITLEPAEAPRGAAPSNAIAAEDGIDRTSAPSLESPVQRVSRGLTSMFTIAERAPPVPVSGTDIAGAVVINSLVALSCVVFAHRYGKPPL